MSEKEREFDALVKLYTEIKSFKIDNSAKILKNFHSENQPKFKLTAEEKEKKSSRLNLSSTTVCAYALSQYQELWKDSGKEQHAVSKFGLPEYYNFIIKALKGFSDEQSGASEQKSINNSSELESTDEFSLLNTLYFLKGIKDKIKEKNKNFNKGSDTVLDIIRKLCEQFIKKNDSLLLERNRIRSSITDSC